MQLIVIMDKTLKCIFRAPSLLFNYTSVTVCGSYKRIHQNSPRNNSTTGKDHEFPVAMYCDKSDNDLFNELRTPASPTAIFRLIKNSAKTMNTKEALVAMESLYHFSKKHRNDKKSMYTQKEFLKLCEIFYQNIRLLNLNQTVQLLKFLSYFEVPVNSMLMQSLLQIARHSINDLSLKQIIFLQFLLSKLKQTPLSEALKISLPIVFEAHLMQQLHEEDFTILASALLYTAYNRLSEKSVDFIIDLMQQRIDEMDVTAAKYVVLAMFILNYRTPAFRSIQWKTLNILSNNSDQISYREMKKIFTSICSHMNNKDSEFYDDNFIEAFIAKLINENRGFYQAINVLDTINCISYSHIPLLDYIATQCFEDSTILTNCGGRDIISLLEGFCLSDYKPLFWEAMQDTILSHRFWDKADYNEIVQAAVRLAILDCHHPKPLQRVFKHVNTSNEKTLEEVLMLYRYTKGLCTSYTGPWPKQEIFDSILFKYEKQKNMFPLLPALEKALGGPEYILTKIPTRYLQQVIDHVIVMRKGGYPIAINLSYQVNDIIITNYLEDMCFPLDSHVILILNTPPSAYPINSRKMTGHWSKTIKALENLLYPVVPMSSTMWSAMPEREKIPYLMQAMKLKCEDSLITANV